MRGWPRAACLLLPPPPPPGICFRWGTCRGRLPAFSTFYAWHRQPAASATSPLTPPTPAPWGREPAPGACNPGPGGCHSTALLLTGTAPSSRGLCLMGSLVSGSDLYLWPCDAPSCVWLLIWVCHSLAISPCLSFQPSFFLAQTSRAPPLPRSPSHLFSLPVPFQPAAPAQVPRVLE